MNTQAVDAFIASISHSAAILAELQEQVENHLGKHPDNLDWSDVGDANRLLGDLKEIYEWVTVE